MKIDALKPYHMYASVSAQGVPSGAGTPQESACSPMARTPAHTDTVSISEQSAAQRDFGRILQQLAAQAHTGASQKHIENLRQQVESGSYAVSAHSLADAILGGIVL